MEKHHIIYMLNVTITNAYLFAHFLDYKNMITFLSQKKNLEKK